MTSLIQELQKKCLDKTISTSDLLIFALFVARKLKLDDFVRWIGNELNGYHTDKVPPYRIIPSELKSWDGCNWIPIDCEYFSKISISQSISQLEGLYDSKSKLVASLPTSTAKNLRKDQERQGFFYIENKSHVSPKLYIRNHKDSKNYYPQLVVGSRGSWDHGQRYEFF